MTLTHLEKTPFPWFGGKSDAAPHIWGALGDVAHYVEPFAGSLAVLLRRPHPCNRTYHSETVNDLDGLLCNAWRSMQLSPDAMAEAASWPVCEADLHARHLALIRWREERQLEHLMGDPAWHDPVMAGWWAWGQSCWIGSGWCAGNGPWIVGDDGRITKREAREPGVSRQLPHLRDDGKGVNTAATREPGVSRQRPHLHGDGQGVNRAGTREPGVSRRLPHLHDDGKGVNRPQAREPGVHRKLPHLGNDGQGVNRPQAREPGVGEYHPMTMPELLRWFRFLSARLRHVRVLNGDWTRAVTHGASVSISCDAKNPCGIFLDPPYSGGVRTGSLYSSEDLTVAKSVREWCAANGDDPKRRIVLAGFAGEGHEELESRGWRAVEWYRSGFLKGGMANLGGNTQQARERLWLSPSCLGGATQASRQTELFE